MALGRLVERALRLGRHLTQPGREGSALRITTFEGDPVGLDLRLEPCLQGRRVRRRRGLDLGQPLMERRDLGLELADPLLGPLVESLQRGPRFVDTLDPTRELLARPRVLGVHGFHSSRQVFFPFVRGGQRLTVPLALLLEGIALGGQRLQTLGVGLEPGLGLGQPAREALAGGGRRAQALFGIGQTRRGRAERGRLFGELLLEGPRVPVIERIDPGQGRHQDPGEELVE